MYSGRKLYKYLAVLVLCLLLAGCAGSHWGRLTHSKKLNDHYLEKNLPAQLNYYYCGRAARPYAVVGIEPSYTFDSRGWHCVESMDELYLKIQKLWKIEDVHSFLNARQIVHSAGGAIGVWFSYYDSTSIRVDEKARRIKVSNPYQAVPRIHKRGYRSIFRDD